MTKFKLSQIWNQREDWKSAICVVPSGGERVAYGGGGGSELSIYHNSDGDDDNIDGGEWE